MKKLYLTLLLSTMLLGVASAGILDIFKQDKELKFNIKNSFDKKINNLSICENPIGKTVPYNVCEKNKKFTIINITDDNLIYQNEDNIYRIKNG